MEVKKFNVKSLLFLVKIRLLQKKFILADQALNSAFKYDNSNNALYIYGALLKLKLNAEPEIILEAVNRARTNTGPASEIRLIEAEALRRAGKSADAIRINEQLLEKSPSGLGLIFSLIELYRTTGQAEKLAAMVQHYRDISRGKDLLTVYRQKEGLRPYKLSPVVTRMLEAEK